MLLALLAQGHVRRVVALIAVASACLGPVLRLVIASAVIHPLADTASLASMIGLGFIVATAVFAPGPVSSHRVLGSIVLYLDIGLCFSTGYRLVLDFAPDALAGLPAGVSEPHMFSALVYFSFVTLTSTGFGDIVAIHPFARSLVILQGTIGQLYPATLLARLVTQHLETRSK